MKLGMDEVLNVSNNCIGLVNGAKCLIHINLCTESDLFPFLFSCIYLKEQQYKIAMILLCPVQGPWVSSLFEVMDISY